MRDFLETAALIIVNIWLWGKVAVGLTIIGLIAYITWKFIKGLTPELAKE